MTSTRAALRQTAGPLLRRAALAARRHPWVIPAVVPVGLFAWAELSHRVLAPGDGFLYYLPMHDLVGDSLRAWQLPQWNPFQFAGSPLLATAQPAPFYPLELCFLVLPSFLANNVYVAGNVLIAAMGTFFFARRLTDDSAGSCVAGLAFASSGFMYAHVGHQSVVAAVAWLPWALHALERLRERVDVGRTVALALPICASLLAGQPQMSLLVVVVVSLYGGTQLLLDRPTTRRLFVRGSCVLAALVVVEVVAPRVLAIELPALLVWAVVLGLMTASAALVAVTERPKALVAAVGAAGLAVMAAAAQLLPVALIVGDTSRSRLSFASATSFSFPGSHLILLLFPRLFGTAADYHGEFNLAELAAYPGAAALVLAAAGIARGRRDARFIALWASAGFATVAALGRTTTFSFLLWETPVFGQFRAWGRYAVVLDLAVAVSAAFGVASLRARAPGAVRAAVVAASACALVGVAVPFLPRVAQYAVSGLPRLEAMALPIGAAFAAVGCAVLFRYRPRLAVVACGVLVVADGLLSAGLGSGLAASPTATSLRSVYSPARAPSWGEVAHAENGVVRYLYAGTELAPALPFVAQATNLKGLRSANGYDPLAPAAYLAAVGMRQDGTLSRPGALLAEPGWVLDLLRVTTVLVPQADLPPAVSPAYRRGSVRAGIARFRYVPRTADAFLVGAAKDASHTSAVGLIRVPSLTFDPRNEALLEECTECRDLKRPGAAGAVLTEHRQSGTIDLDVASTRPGALVVSEAWFPGWHATVDGEPTPVMRANGIVLGVVVPEGRHHVRLSYEAPGAKAGLALSAVFLAVFALVTCGGLLKHLISARRR